MYSRILDSEKYQIYYDFCCGISSVDEDTATGTRLICLNSNHSISWCFLVICRRNISPITNARRTKNPEFISVKPWRKKVHGAFTMSRTITRVSRGVCQISTRLGAGLVILLEVMMCRALDQLEAFLLA